MVAAQVNVEREAWDLPENEELISETRELEETNMMSWTVRSRPAFGSSPDRRHFVKRRPSIHAAETAGAP